MSAGLYLLKRDLRATAGGSKEPLFALPAASVVAAKTNQLSPSFAEARAIYSFADSPRNWIFPRISYKNPKDFGKITHKILLLAHFQAIKALKLDSFARLLKKSKRNARFCCIFFEKTENYPICTFPLQRIDLLHGEPGVLCNHIERDAGHLEILCNLALFLRRAELKPGLLAPLERKFLLHFHSFIVIAVDSRSVFLEPFFHLSFLSRK